MNVTINNSIGLLKECLHNCDKGSTYLYGWCLGEKELIKQTINELEEIENEQENPADGVTAAPD